MSLINGVSNSREEVDEFFTKSFEKLKASREAEYQRQNNPPECPDTCELKQNLLEVPKEEFNIEGQEAEDIIERFMKEDLSKIKNLEIKIQIEELEKEKKTIENKINHLYQQIFSSISEDVSFNRKVLEKIYQLIHNNSIEDLQKFYANSEEE